ncbi:hypothetical protein CkP1_0155 [Citrobacter phage CkP1]|nr:hypothetical protein CkP1_0155 [Citrobacter phage CkP1]
MTVKNLVAKVKTFVSENYAMTGVNKYDYIALGVLIGAALAVSKSILLTIGVMGFLVHKSFSK